MSFMSIKTIKNIFYSFIVNGGNYAFPFFVLFFASNILGRENFGVYAICTGVAIFFQVFVDFGFSLSACREVSNHKDDSEELSTIFLSVFFIKILLIVLSLLFLIFYIFLFKINYFLYLLVSVSCAYISSLIPFWFFQGLGKYRFVAIAVSSGRLFGILLAIFLVKNESDLIYLMISQLVGVLLPFVFIYFYLFRNKFFLPFKKISKDIIYKNFILGWNTFGANIASLVMANSGVLILGIYHGVGVVGVYAAIDRLVKMLVSLLQPLTQVFFPINASAFGDEKNKGIKKLIGNNIVILLYGIFLLIFFLFFLEKIEHHFNFNSNDVLILKVLLLWFLVGVLNNIMGVQILTASGKSSVYSRMFLIVTFIFILLAFPIINIYSGLGLAYLMLGCESFLALMLIVYISRNYKNEK